MSVATVEPAARHQHGRNCPCRYCRAIRVAQTQRWRRRRDEGEVFWMDAAPVRAHVQHLMTTYGIPADSIAAQVGVSHGTVRNLLYGNGTPPSSRLVAINGQRLLTAHFDLDSLRPGTLINPTGTQRRVQGLVVAGYCVAEQARRLGRGRDFYHAIMADWVRVELARAVRDLADALETVPPPASTRVQRAAVSKARNMAAQHPEWVPLAAWDDIDNPNASPITASQPDLLPDPEVVARILAGVKSSKGLREVDVYAAITQLATQLTEEDISLAWALSKRLRCNGDIARRLIERAAVYELLVRLDGEGALDFRLLRCPATLRVHVVAAPDEDPSALCGYRGDAEPVDRYVGRTLCPWCRLSLGPFWPRVQALKA